MYKKISNLLIIFVFLLFVFTRSFAGLYIGYFRVGEYIMAFGLIATMIFIFVPNKFLGFSRLSQNIVRLIFFSFLITVYLSSSSLFATYTYRTSSYIWTLGYIFIGYYFFQNKISKKEFYFLAIGLIIIYIFGTGSYPDKLMIAFQEYGDKFTFVKAADMVLAIIITNVLALNVLDEKKSYIYFIFSTCLFLPLIIQMSRGAFGSLLIFVLIYLCFNFKYVFFNFKNILILIIFSISVLFLSSLRVLQFDVSTVVAKDNSEVVQIFDEEINKISRTSTNENIDTFMSLYFEQRYVPNKESNATTNVKIDTGWHNKLISSDGTFNWRLSMWQDLYYYQASEDKVLFGYGHTEVLPVFNLDYDYENKFRIGHDKSNEQVHNYLINIFGRGGLIQLILIICLHFSLYIYYFKKFKNHYALILIIPPLLNSMTDITMEGVQFPVLLYIFYGYILFEGINLKSEKTK